MGFSAFIARVLGSEQRRTAGDWMELLGSRNGYERQVAIEMLRDLRFGPALPQLLVRVNDWVPQVRAAARAAIRTFLEEAFVPDWTRTLDSVVALECARRADHKDLLDVIADFLADPHRVSALAAASPHASMSVKRYLFDLRWRGAGDDASRFELLLQAFRGADVPSARRALERMDVIVSSEQRSALAGAACCSRFAPIRAAGLRLALDAPTAATPSLVRAMALDDSPTVRAIALNSLKPRGDVAGVLAIAIAQLGQENLDGRTRATALQFVCSVGAADSRQHCELASRASSPAVLRRSALSLLFSLTENGEKTSLLLRALSDVSPKVQRLAVEQVLRGAAAPSEAQIFELASIHGTDGALSRAFSILTRSSTWTRLQWLLHACRGGLPNGGAELCLRAIEQWEVDARRNFVEPTSTQLRALSIEWELVKHLLPDPLRIRVGFHLKAFGIEESTPGL